MAWKVIKCFLACIRSIPVLFITLILLWSYYAYVVQLCIFTVENVAETVLYLIFYHPLAILMAWSYWKAIFTPISTTPKQFFLSESDVEQYEIESNAGNRKEFLEQWSKELPLQCRLTTGGIRFCEKCKAVKPDRAHHCSICDRCVLKMDHHCPWINNCVCFSTYKFFLLFLMYSLFYCIYVACTSLHYFIRFWMRIGGDSHGMQGLHIVFLFIASLLFGVCLTTLFGYHCYLVARNKSTIEAYQTPVFSSGPDKDGFSIGWSENFLQVFGTEKRFWFLPIFTSIGDGVSFPSRNTLSANYYHSMETTATAFSISETIQSPPDGLLYHVTLNDTDGDQLLGQSSQRQKFSDSHASNGSSQGYFYNAGNEDVNPS